VTGLPLRIHPPFRFAHRVRVRFAETDAQQVVYNGSYLTYFEVARIEYFRELGFLKSVNQTVAEACVQYKAPARWDDQLDLGCRCAHVGRTSFRLEYALHEVSEDCFIATGHTIQVTIDEAGRPQPIPAHVRNALERHEGFA
jgi:acyl-CoA thioester hydrolase